MRMFIEFRSGTDARAAEDACRAEGMTMIGIATGLAAANGGVHVEGDTDRMPEAVRDAVAARLPGAVEFAGLTG